VTAAGGRAGAVTLALLATVAVIAVATGAGATAGTRTVVGTSAAATAVTAGGHAAAATAPAPVVAGATTRATTTTEPTATATTVTAPSDTQVLNAPTATRGGLLAGPGCEAGGETAPPDGWIDDSASGPSVYCTSLGGTDEDGTDLTTQSAPEGTLAFADGRADGTDKLIVQTVPATGDRTYELAGGVGTDDALSTVDHLDAELQFRDGQGTVLSTVDLTELRSPANDSFDRFSLVETAPANAERARVRLRFDNADGSGYAAVFVDGLSLRPTGPGVDARNDTLVVATDAGAGGTLPPTTLLADSGHGADRRGPSGATVASFGGGDLGGSVGDTPAGTSVPLAGGDLTVRADGTVSVTGATSPGEYAFRYRLSDGAAADSATVRVRVVNGSRNLLAVPGCEVRTPGGGAVGWTDAGGVAAGCLDPAGASFTSQQQPSGGFAIGDTRSAAAATGEDVTLRQRVPVVAGATYRLAARVGTDETLSTADHADLTVRYVDDTGAVLPGGTVQLRDLRSDTDDAFDRHATVWTAPAAASAAEVTVRVDNADGSGHADAFVDDVVLRRVAPGVRAVDDGPFVTPAYRTLTPEGGLLADRGFGADGRGPAGNATVVAFGGGDLVGDVDTYRADATATLAGGELTVAADGTLELRRPTEPGRYAFRYRLSNGTDSDVGTARVHVTDLGGTLLATPGCERHGLADRPLGWTDESGGRGVACLDLRGGRFTTQSQPNGTYAFGDRTAGGGDESVVQTVPVTPGRAYGLSARVGTDADRSKDDAARLELRFRRANGTRIDGAGATLSTRSPTDGTFTPVETRAVAPPGATEALVRVTLVDEDGGYADTFVDDLRLATAPVAPTARDDGPAALTVDDGGTLGPGQSVLADNGNGTDDRGFPTATVSAFGGGDLGATVDEYAPGSTVALAGGNLTLTADGSLTLTGPTEGGEHRFRYRLSNAGGSDAGTVTVRVRAPEIALRGNGTPIASGDDTPSRADGTAFGAVPVENGSATATFRVHNTGTERLRLDGTPRVNVTGPNATEFAVTRSPNATVPPGGSTTFAVTFDPSGVDARTATLSIPSTDRTEDPYTVAVGGVGTDTLTAVTGPATNVTAGAAALAGTVDPGGRSTTVAFEYWPTGAPAVARTVTAEGSPVAGVDPVAVDGRVTGLVPDRRYTYRTVATNPNGTVRGTNRTFRTEVAAPTATTLEPATVTPTGARFRGRVDPGNGSTDVAFEYYPAGRPAAATTIPAVESPVDGPTPVSVNATPANLTPETAYAVRVVASNVAGRDAGATRTVTTPSAPPNVGSPGPFTIVETAPDGALVGDLNATDGEGGAVDDNVTYALVGGNGNGNGNGTGIPDLDGDGTPALAIDAADGRLRVADDDDLDYETNASIPLRVRVDDDAGRSVTATVTVDVTDAPPRVSNGSIGGVAETAPNGTVVGTVPVSGDDTSVTLSITGGNPDLDPDGDGTPAFAVDATTGVVTVADPDDLDHEATEAVDVTVEATDGSTRSLGSARVTVTDVDERPVFVAAGPFAVAETAPDGTLVGDVNATDGDGGSVDEGVTYALNDTATPGLDLDPDDDGTPAVALDHATGVVTVADADDLDHETASAVTLSVDATDGAGTTTRTVRVDVTDVAPALSDGAVGSVPETAPNGTVVGTVPVDGDDTSVTLSIAGGTPDLDPDGDATPAFTLDPASGAVTVTDADDLDHEVAPAVDLFVEATDGTTAARATATIEVTDVAPTVSNGTVGPVDDDAGSRTTVGTVPVSGDDTSVTLSIAGDNPDPDGDGTPAFALDGPTVALADADDVDAGRTTAVPLQVTATDGTTTDGATVTVEVTDATPPTADAGANRTVELGETVTLDATGSADNVGVTDYAWDVGADGTVDATGPTLPYTPDRTGATVVRLDVSDAAGNEATDLVTVTVVDTTPPTVPDLSNRTVDEDTPVAFAANATDAGTLGYEWAFGDGTNATGSAVSHAYPQPGTYRVRLTVTDGAGNTVRESATVTVRDATPPTAQLAANRTGVLVGQPIRFDAANASDNVAVAGYDWTLGDGTTATGAAVTHAYDAPSSYPVAVTVRDAAGNEATANTTVRVDTRANLSVAFRAVTDRVTAGSPVNATVEVTNRGTLTGTGVVTLSVNGTTVDTATVSVAGDATETATLTWTPRDGQTGTYVLAAASPNDTTAAAPTMTVDPLRVDVTVRDAPTAVSEGDTAVVAVDVTNPGDSGVTRRVALADGPTTVDRANVTLAAGETRRVELRWNTSGATAGGHQLVVTTGNVTAATPIAVVPATPFPNGLPGDRQHTPQDVDADPRYEDVNGDGRVSFLDVVTLVFADFETIDANPAQRAALDFDGDGDFDYVDVVDLVFQL
jgi:PKD repeat protein